MLCVLITHKNVSQLQHHAGNMTETLLLVTVVQTPR